MKVRLAWMGMLAVLVGLPALSAPSSGDRPLTKMTLPIEANSKHGHPGGPINVVIVADPAHLDAALEKAGWTRADKTTVRSAARIAKDVLKHKPYPAAPVSPAYLYGRKQDEAWEKEAKDPTVRDHLRLWDSGQKDAKGRHFYAVDASKDVAVGRKPETIKPTHKIDPDVDREATTLQADLQHAGVVASAYTLKGSGPRESIDVARNHYHTSGQVRVIVLQ